MPEDPPNYWEDSASIPDPGAACTPFEGEAQCEVAIIGGGYTGLCAALELARGGVDVRLLEARRIGWGASGRNGGFCCVGSAKLSYAAMVQRHGWQGARELFQAQLRAVRYVSAVAAAHSIALQPQGEGELEIAHRPAAMADLRARAGLLQQVFDYRAQLVEPGELCAQVGDIGRHGGLRMPDGYGLHPVDYVRGLANTALRAGARLHAGSEVTGWRAAHGRHLIETSKGRLTARRVLLATAGYTPEALHPRLRGTMLPVASSILVTRPLTAAERAAQSWHTATPAADSRNLVHYFRLLPDGRFLFGGRGGTGEDRALPLQHRLRRRFAALFPAWRDVEHTHFWSGQLCMARDLLPHIGPLDGVPGAYAALCYHGNGVAMASWAGTAVARAMRGRDDGIPALLRRPLPRFPFPRLRPAYLRLALAGYALADSGAAATFKSWSCR
jgi:glycine/D-amino acid oxidase-like deaminating enzyme